MPLTFLFWVVLCATLASAAAADWPCWRGPRGTGQTPAEWVIPKTLPTELKVIWRTAIGAGFASPILSQGKVFHLDCQEGQEVVHALEAGTGKELWRARLDEAFLDAQGAAGPRCTALADGDRIYAQSCRGELQCLTAQEGRLLWQVNFVKDFGAAFIGEKGSAVGAVRHGYTGAPLVDGGRLFVTVGGSDGASVVCFEKKTGKVIWKSQNDVAGYAPPVLATLAGTPQLVVFTAEAIIGLAPTDGKLLWRVAVKTSFGRHVTTPVIHNDLVIVSSHQAGLLGIKVTQQAGGFAAEKAWTAKDSALNFASPVAFGKHLVGPGPGKKLVCVDMEAGTQTWAKDGFFTTAPGYTHAGMIGMGQNILTLTDGGALVLFAAAPSEYREISRTQVCGKNWCNPAYADGRLYLRDARELICVQLVP